MTFKQVCLGAGLVAAFATPVLTQSLAVDLQRAKQRELATGDCKAVLSEYTRIAEQGAKTERPAAAEALLRSAMCHEQLRDGQAESIYGRVVRDFRDVQSVAQEAAHHLPPRPAVGNDAGGGESSRAVWTIPANASIVGSVSRDGRFMAFVGGDLLMVHDFISGADRVVGRPRAGDAGFHPRGAAFSQNGRWLAYRVGIDMGVSELRVIDLQAAGAPAPKLVLREDADPRDWTPDGKWIVVRVMHGDQLFINRDPVRKFDVALVSIDTGEKILLKSYEARTWQPLAMALSPDGSRLAVEVPDASGTLRDIEVLPVDGRPGTRAVTLPGDDILLGWSPGGSGVLFGSARSGALAMWLQRLDARGPSGSPELIRGSAPAWSLGLTSSGQLFFGIDNSAGTTVKEGEFDFTTGSFTVPLSETATTFVRASFAPRWSRDGESLGYVSVRAERGGDVLVIRSLQSGQQREVLLPVPFRGGNRDLWMWTPDGKSIVLVGEDRDPSVGTAIFQVGIANGITSVLVPRDPGGVAGHPFQWSDDGKSFFYRYPAAPKQYIRVRRDLATGAEEPAPEPPTLSPDKRRSYSFKPATDGWSLIERDEITQAEHEVLALQDRTWHLTLDGKYVMGITGSWSSGKSLVRRSVTSGEQLTVFQATQGQELAIALVAPDDRSAILRVVAPGVCRYWWVPFDGRPARRITELDDADLGAQGFGHEFELHPDGRHLAISVQQPRLSNDQVVMLEHFLPSPRR